MGGWPDRPDRRVHAHTGAPIGCQRSRCCNLDASRLVCCRTAPSARAACSSPPGARPPLPPCCLSKASSVASATTTTGNFPPHTTRKSARGRATLSSSSVTRLRGVGQRLKRRPLLPPPSPRDGRRAFMNANDTRRATIAMNFMAHVLHVLD